MDMILYNCSMDPRELNKSMTNIATVNILAVTDTNDITSPYLIIDTRAFDFNYVYIPAWNRYYFAKIDVIDGMRIGVRCEEDFLMSHRQSILKSQVIAKRSASAPNAFIPDPVCGDEGTMETIYRNVSNTCFNSIGSYLLTVAGK